jgi:5-formyltetrahydrofolate cyclo-ligase
MSEPTSKSEIRSQMRSSLAQIDANARHDCSVAATALLSSCSEFRNARVVMIFVSTAEEIETAGVASRCWLEGKTVVVPKVSWDQRRMMPVEINSLSNDALTTTRHGIREPVAGNPMPLEMIDLALVPGLGFTGAGGRIGRGMGFYDRFLADPKFLGVSCGFAFESQVVEHVPSLDHDIPVMMLVTERSVRRFSTHCLKR